MTRAATIYTYALAANATVQLPVDGGFYKLLGASGAVGIARDGNAALSLDPGQGERENFKFLTITDLSGATNNIELIVADSSFVDDRIYGNVQVIDGGRLITMANQSFGGWVQQAASVGNFSHLQLWNPVGRTVNIALSSLSVSSFTAQGFQLRWITSPLATLWANPNSKKIGIGPNSTAELRNDAQASILGNGANIVGWFAANTVNSFTFKEPIVIQPGIGLMVVGTTANTQISASFDFYEFTP